MILRKQSVYNTCINIYIQLTFLLTKTIPYIIILNHPHFPQEQHFSIRSFDPPKTRSENSPSSWFCRVREGHLCHFPRSKAKHPGLESLRWLHPTGWMVTNIIHVLMTLMNDWRILKTSLKGVFRNQLVTSRIAGSWLEDSIPLVGSWSSWNSIHHGRYIGWVTWTGWPPWRVVRSVRVKVTLSAGLKRDKGKSKGTSWWVWTC